jgi:hypothetical protein
VKAILLCLLLLPALFAGDTNTIKAITQPFKVTFDHKPLSTNETYSIYAHRGFSKKNPIATLKLDELEVLENKGDGTYTFTAELVNTNHAGNYKITIVSNNNGVESDESNWILLNVLEPAERFNGQALRIFKLDEFIIIYYHPSTILYYSEDLINWLPVTDAYNPHIIDDTDKVHQKKFWQALFDR